MKLIRLPSGRTIGPREKCFVIAEVGSNWRDLNDCLHSIAMAKAAGADAVKFQLFGPRTLHGMIEGEQTARADGYLLDLSNLAGISPYLDPDWLPKLKENADDCGIEFMCTAFSPELVDAVDPFVNLHKVASAELSHVRLLERIASKGKPVILSTGASGKADISQALKFLEPSGEPVVLMYCVAAYPARDVDFRMMEQLWELNPHGLVGYSDHTIDYGVIPLQAFKEGAHVIEKHFTDIPDVATPDRPHSLTVDEFKKMVQTLRGERPFAWGSGEERDMILRHNRRLIVTADVAVGDVLEEGKNFGIYRSLKDDAHGLSPFHIAKVHGRTAAKAMSAGQAIGPGDFS